MPLGWSDLLLYADRSDAIYNITHNFDRNEIKIEGAALNADFSCGYSHSATAHRILLNWRAFSAHQPRSESRSRRAIGHFSPGANYLELVPPAGFDRSSLLGSVAGLSAIFIPKILHWLSDMIVVISINF